METKFEMPKYEGKVIQIIIKFELKMSIFK
jgi:hypothetical protein